MAQTTQISDFKINKMTSAQYSTITPSATELYLITDDSGITSNDIATALGYTPVKKVSTTNPALTSSNGVCTWTFTNPINSADVKVSIYEINSSINTVMYPPIDIAANAITVTILSNTNISAGSLKAVIEG